MATLWTGGAEHVEFSREVNWKTADETFVASLQLKTQQCCETLRLCLTNWTNAEQRVFQGNSNNTIPIVFGVYNETSVQWELSCVIVFVMCTAECQDGKDTCVVCSCSDTCASFHTCSSPKTNTRVLCSCSDTRAPLPTCSCPIRNTFSPRSVSTHHCAPRAV